MSYEELRPPGVPDDKKFCPACTMVAATGHTTSCPLRHLAIRQAANIRCPVCNKPNNRHARGCTHRGRLTVEVHPLTRTLPALPQGNNGR